MKRTEREIDCLWLVLSLVVCSTFWYWARHIYIPANAAEVQARGLPVGNNSDLYPRWLGAKELLLHGRDPYGSDVTREIQIGFYGRPLDPRKSTDPRAQESFVYPLWVVFLIAPSVTIPFAAAREIFRWILVGSMALSTALWMEAIGIRFRSLLLLSMVLLVFSSLPYLVEYYQQNLTALFVFFVALAAFCVTKMRLGIAGFFLALATMKPDVTGLLIMWFLIWAAARVKERQRMVWTFGVTITVLWASSEMVLPHWVERFLKAVSEYPAYGTTPNILQSIFSQWPGTVFTVALLGALVSIWVRSSGGGADTAQFRRAIVWTCIVTLAVIPKTAFYNQVLLIPPLLWLGAEYGPIRRSGVIGPATATAPFVCLLLQWATAAILTLAALLGVPDVISFIGAELPDRIFLAVAPLTLLAVLLTTFYQARTGRTLSPAEVAQ